MSINGVTSLRGGLVSSLLQTTISRLRPAGSSSTTKSSPDSLSAAGSLTFDPAVVLGGSSTSFSNGLYNSKGSLVSAGTTQAAAGASTSASAKQRIASLKSAAAKIDDGETQQGRKEAESVLAKNASDVSALRLVAHSYLAEQDYKQAERYYARTRDLSPDNQRVRGDLNNVRALQKSDGEALAVARTRLKSPAHRPEGLRLLLRLSNRSPDNVEVYLALADGFAAAGKPLQVVGALQEAVRLADKNEIDQVISRAQELVKEHPGVGLPHNMLGRALQKAGRLSEAIAELNTAVKAVPGNLGYVRDLAGAYVARARVKLEAGDVVSAETDLQSARSIDPANSELAEVSARVAAHHAGRDIASGRYVAALSELSVAASDAPDDAQFKKRVAALYTRVAVHFHNQGDDAQALSSYTRAYELDPTSPAVRRNVGQLSHERGLNALDRKDYDVAIEHLDRGYQAVRTNDTYREDLAGAYDLRGQYWVSRGELDKAIVDFKTGYRLDPSNASLSANLSSAVKQSLAT